MAFKLALNAGHGINTAGKRCDKKLDPNQTREWVLNSRIVTKIIDLLKSYNGIEILRIDDPTGKEDIPLSTRTSKANKWKADFYLAVHHNAGVNGGTGGGIETYIYTTASQSSKDWQSALYKALIKHTNLKGNRSDGTRAANLHEVRETTMPAVLLECGFMDSKTDVPIILTDKFAQQVAEACVEVIVSRAKLTKKKTTTTTAKTYQVVTTINKYSSADDAKSKKNNKGTITKGTYYIYTKYPSGYNGMYNITSDKTGKEAGFWINPNENVVKTEVKEEVQKLYRVRKTWEDSKSQVGAYSSLDSAKSSCQSAGKGYNVFDWNGKKVYSYTEPKTVQSETPKEETKKETTSKKVYELQYPVKHKICEYTTLTDIGYQKEFTQCCEIILKNNPSFDIEIVKAFFKLAPIYGIDATRAISQSILETGWFKYNGSAVKPEHHNYCGLGVTTTGKPGSIFDTIENGVRAQLQHLFAYGSKESLPNGEKLVDERFKYVTRGIAPTWEELAGRWAVPGFDGKDAEAAIKAGTTYGQKIDKIYQGIVKTTVKDADIKKYFTTEEIKTPTKEDNNTVTQPVIDNDTKEKVNFIFDFIKKLIDFFSQFIKK